MSKQVPMSELTFHYFPFNWMITRKEHLLIRPFQHKNFVEHRKKIRKASPRIDVVTPPQRNHVQYKYKKVQAEAERHARIERENFILLEHLDTIMTKKRIDNRWLHEQPKFLNKIKLFSAKKKRKSPGRFSDSCHDEKAVNHRNDRGCVTCQPVNHHKEFVDDVTNLESIRKSLNDIAVKSVTVRPNAQLRMYSGTVRNIHRTNTKTETSRQLNRVCDVTTKSI